MKILVVCQYYYPEPFRIHEVCEELVNRGHEVTVLTGLPNYPMGVIPEEYKHGAHRDEMQNGVHVYRVNEIPRKKGKIGLALNYVSYVFFASLKALTMQKDFDTILVYQLSPVLMAIPAYVVKWTSSVKNLYIYCLDLWPESLSSLGIGRDSVFYKFMKIVSIRIYKGAKGIGYTSKLFKRYFVKDLKVRNRNFIHIPQFADELFLNVPKEEDIDRDENVINYVFAGNIGEMQSVETIVRAASLCEDDRIRWHIVGDGSRYDNCRALAKELRVTDKVIFYGRRPVEEMPKFYAMADAMIVPLAKNKTISYTLPGKIQSYMAAKKAVLGCAMGETKRTIKEAQCGMCAKSEDAYDLAAVAAQLANEDLVQLGLNARRYYEENFSKKGHVDLIENMICADN